MTDIGKLYKLLNAASPKKYIFILFVCVILFVSQCYLIYFDFIPRVVDAYASVLSPAKTILLKETLHKLISWWLVWPIMLFSLLGAMIVNARSIQRLLPKESVEIAK